MPDKVLAFYIRLSSEDRDLKTKGTRRCNLTYWRWAWDEAKHKSKRNIL